MDVFMDQKQADKVRKRDLSAWTSRKELLEEFIRELEEYFPEENYNIFVFGSFIRKDFCDGRSDIDLIIYCEDRLKMMELEELTRNFFENAGLEADILPYYFMSDAYIYAVGILNSIHLTDYYPKKLKDELYIIAGNYAFYKKENELRKKYQKWEYVIQKRNLIKQKEMEKRW